MFEQPHAPQPAPPIAPDRRKYWDGSQWTLLPGPVCEWDGFRFHAKPVGVESNWDGHRWSVKPEGDSRWHDSRWQVKPPGAESRWDGQQWVIKPEGEAGWTGSAWQVKPDGDFRWTGSKWVRRAPRWLTPVIVVAIVAVTGLAIGVGLHQKNAAEAQAAAALGPCISSAEQLVNADHVNEQVEGISAESTPTGIVCTGAIVQRFDSGALRSEMFVNWNPDNPIETRRGAVVAPAG